LSREQRSRGAEEQRSGGRRIQFSLTLGFPYIGFFRTTTPYMGVDRKKQGYKPPDLSVEKTKILSLFQAPGFRHGVNLKSKI